MATHTNKYRTLAKKYQLNVDLLSPFYARACAITNKQFGTDSRDQNARTKDGYWPYLWSTFESMIESFVANMPKQATA